MKKICGIYKIINPKGKIYIGQSTNIHNRFNQYRKLWCKDQPLLYNSLIKYGIKNHKYTIIIECNLSKLNDLERFYIEKYKTFNRDYGLNLTNGGTDYFKHSTEVREKMSIAQKGNKKTLGRKQSKEEIKKRILKLTGQKRTPEQRKRISNGLKGRKLSKQHLENIKKGNKLKNAKKVIDTNTNDKNNRMGSIRCNAYLSNR